MRIAFSLLNHSPQIRGHYHTLPKLLNNFPLTSKLLVRNVSNDRRSFRPNGPPSSPPMRALRVLVRLILSLEKNRRKCMMQGTCVYLFPSLDTTRRLVLDCTLVSYRHIYFSSFLYEQIPATIPRYLASVFLLSPSRSSLVPWILILSLHLGNLRILAYYSSAYLYRFTSMPLHLRSDLIANCSLVVSTGTQQMVFYLTNHLM